MAIGKCSEKFRAAAAANSDEIEEVGVSGVVPGVDAENRAGIESLGRLLTDAWSTLRIWPSAELIEGKRGRFFEPSSGMPHRASSGDGVMFTEGVGVRLCDLPFTEAFDTSKCNPEPFRGSSTAVVELDFRGSIAFFGLAAHKFQISAPDLMTTRAIRSTVKLVTW